MSTSNGKNKSNSSSDKADPAPLKPGEPAPKTDESRFLAQQAADAKAAIKAAFADIATGCGQSVSVGGWMKQYPWLTLGASTVAGFVASAMIVPSKEEQALRKLAKIERALNPPRPKAVETEEDEDADKAAGAKQYKSGRTSFMRSVMGEVIKAVQPAVVSLLTAGVTAQAAKPSQEEMQAAAAAEDQRSAGVPPTE